jgi:hypothetical protein
VRCILILKQFLYSKPADYFSWGYPARGHFQIKLRYIRFPRKLAIHLLFRNLSSLNCIIVKHDLQIHRIALSEVGLDSFLTDYRAGYCKRDGAARETFAVIPTFYRFCRDIGIEKNRQMTVAFPYDMDNFPLLPLMPLMHLETLTFSCAGEGIKTLLFFNFFFNLHSGEWSPNWVHSARRPLTGLLYLLRVIVRMEKLV